MSDPPVPDRYADAVHARRSEIRLQLQRLTGGHRAELRTCLALSRLTAAEQAAAALARLGRDARVHVERADRRARRRLPALLAAAVADLLRALHAGWAAALRPGLRRIGTERALDLDPGWPRLPIAPLVAVPVPPPEAVGPARSLLAGVMDGAALGRMALLPLAVLPLLGLPALGGAALAPLAVGTGLVAVVVAAKARRTAVERSLLRRHVDDVLAATRTAVDVDIGRRLLRLERSAGAALDAAVARRRAALDAELALLAPDRTGPA